MTDWRHWLPPVTLILIGLSALVVGVILLNASVLPVKFLFISEYYGRELKEIKLGQVWRLVTPIILHLDLFHFVFNAIALWELGHLLERYLGSIRFIFFVLIVAICTNLAQYAWGGFNFGGLSGVIMAMLGFMWTIGRFDKSAHFHIPPLLIIMIGLFFLVSWLGFLGRNMANMSHTAGFILGVVLGWFYPLFAKKMR